MVLEGRPWSGSGVTLQIGLNLYRLTTVILLHFLLPVVYRRVAYSAPFFLLPILMTFKNLQIYYHLYFLQMTPTFSFLTRMRTNYLEL